MSKFKYIALTLLAGAAITASAQNGTQEFLKMVGEQSPYIEAERKSADARIITSKSDNTPVNPEASFGYMPGIEQTDGIRKSYGITQPLSWPGEYIAKSKYNKLERKQAEVEYSGSRQDILLRAKLLCYDLVYLQKRKALLDERLENVKAIIASTEKLHAQGEATSLDLNKVRINYLSVKTAWEENNAQLKIKSEQLAAVAGFENFDIGNFSYIDNAGADTKALYDQALEANVQLAAAQLEVDKSNRNVSVQRAATLPSISIGAAGERITPTDSYFGVTAGLSIPLWGGANKVKAAKAQKIATELKSESLMLDVQSALSEQVANVNQIRESFNSYGSLQEVREGKTLLSKSFNLQYIPMTNYLVDMEYYYGIEEEYLTLELNLYRAIAELTKFGL